MPQKDLWRSEDEIRSMLQTALDQARDKPMEFVEGSLQLALEMMSATLYQALAQYKGFSEGPDVYFWPGYNSVLTRLNAESRLTLKDKEGRACGIGFVRSPADKYYNCHGQIAFSELLVRDQSDRLARGIPFNPGGTHAWISAGEWKLPKDIPLNVLAIEILNVGAEPKQHPAGPDNGILWIPLSRHTFSKWGDIIAGVLNDKSRVWDSMSSKTAVSVIWPYADTFGENAITDQEARQVSRLRLDLYTAWLASNLCVSKVNCVARGVPDFPGWITGFASKLKAAGLDRLSGYVGSLLDSPAEIHCLPYWYTFNLGRTVSTRPTETKGIAGKSRRAFENELGSLMILSSVPIEPAFFSLTKPWIERIYTWMRAVESSILTLRAGAESQSREFVHQTDDLIKVILSDPGIDNLSPSGRSAAWHLQAVFRVWSNKRFEGKQSIIASHNQLWAKFGSRTDREFLLFLIDQAMRHAFRRASVVSDEINDLVGDMVFDYVLAHFHSPEDAHAQLAMVLRGDPPPWVKTEGFVVAFHHCFWQAAHHGLRASFAGLTPPYLWIDCGADHVTVHNRSERSEFKETPKDWMFFRRLEQRVRGFLTIRSFYDETERAVVTCIAREVPE